MARLPVTSNEKSGWTAAAGSGSSGSSTSSSKEKTKARQLQKKSKDRLRKYLQEAVDSSGDQLTSLERRTVSRKVEKYYKFDKTWRALKDWRTRTPGRSRLAHALGVWAAVSCQQARGNLTTCHFDLLGLSCYTQPSEVRARCFRRKRGRSHPRPGTATCRGKASRGQSSPSCTARSSATFAQPPEGLQRYAALCEEHLVDAMSAASRVPPLPFAAEV